MAKLIPNTFTAYSLDDKEEIAGTVLNVYQLYVIQNRIAATAKMKLDLIFDPKNPADFGIQTAYQTGKLDVLQQMLDDSEEMTRAISQTAAQSQE